MTTFLCLLGEKDKANNLLASCSALRTGHSDARVYEVAPELFSLISGSPFAYSVSGKVRGVFKDLRSVSDSGVVVAEGLNTTDNERFLRLYWEVSIVSPDRWALLAKGGEHSRYYADLHLAVNWRNSGAEMKAISKQMYGSETKRIYGQSHYFRSGLTYSQRTQKGLSFRVFPEGAIFNVKGPALITEDPHPFALLALANSSCFRRLVELQTSFGSYNVGYLQKTPLAEFGQHKTRLTDLARSAWRLKRALDTTEETSHAFALPAALRARLGDDESTSIEAELERIQSEIDAIALDLYGISGGDFGAEQGGEVVDVEGEPALNADGEGNDDDDLAIVDLTAGLLSWAVGVAYGRFDWRLATGERAAPRDPEPFDPLPGRSPGMLPDGSGPFHAHAGILVDEQGHPHDLARLIEEVLVRVDAPVPGDVRRWLQREFFGFHLQRYSKSRRKAPIYWPLSTMSGSYTLWVYYPSLSSQTLYAAINDFVEPKLKQVGADVTALRKKGSARTRDDERQFEAMQAFELELIELRDTLLKLAPTYKPNHDDGVQISAAPLWPLFRHKPWQKVLKETWAKLEKGDYDWAHLAMNYWPERVREKCKTDKSLAIAHGLVDLYIEPEAKPKKARGRKKTGGDE